MSGSGISWGGGHMQVCTTLQTDNHASIPPLSFLQAGCPSCHPTNRVKALKAFSIVIVYYYIQQFTQFFYFHFFDSVDVSIMKSGT